MPRHHHRRRLSDGREIDVGVNGNIRKICSCPRSRWPKCRHGWHFSLMHEGVHHRKAANIVGRLRRGSTMSRTEAERLFDRWKDSVRNGGVKRERSDAASSSVTLRDAVKQYVEAFVVSPLRRCEAKAEMTRLIEVWLTSPLADGSTLADRALPSITAGDITRVVDVRHAREKVRGDKSGRVGTNRQLSRLRHFYGWCIRRGLVAVSPFTDQSGQPAVQFAKGVEQPRTRRLREGEEGALLAGANPHLRALIVAALDTACRIGELLNLTFGDVDEERGTLTIRPEVSKTNRERRVPMTSRVRAIVSMRRTAPDGNQHEPCGFVFGNQVGEPIKDIKTAWQSCCRRAGVSGLHFHDLRREAASRLLEAGVGLHVVSAWLGHSSIAQTATYLSINSPQLQDARAKLEAALAAAEDAARRVAQQAGADPHRPALSSVAACENLAMSAAPSSAAASSELPTDRVH